MTKLICIMCNKKYKKNITENRMFDICYDCIVAIYKRMGFKYDGDKSKADEIPYEETK